MELLKEFKEEISDIDDIVVCDLFLPVEEEQEAKEAEPKETKFHRLTYEQHCQVFDHDFLETAVNEYVSDSGDLVDYKDLFNGKGMIATALLRY